MLVVVQITICSACFVLVIVVCFLLLFALYIIVIGHATINTMEMFTQALIFLLNFHVSHQASLC